MNYQETTEWLFSQVPMFQNLGSGAYKPGLDTTLALAESNGMPHTKFPTVHIAGTNGKGSTAHTIAAILQSAGYKTGLYTSPHLLDFRERIKIDGKPVSEKFVVDFIERYRASDLTERHPTFFELTTIMAFSYFAEMGVDVAVIETGLGGRLDSTNIIMPVLSVITNISLDHTALLGNTPEEIAFEKAGIIKPGVPVIIGNAKGVVRKVFKTTARERGSEIVFAQDEIQLEAVAKTDYIDYEYAPLGHFHGELAGDCQIENTRTILAAVAKLGQHFSKIDKGAIRNGFENVTELTGLMGRWMQIEKEPVRIICDTGHNIGGWKYLGPRLKKIAESENRLHIILGFVSDKDVDAIVRELPENASYYFAKPSVERGRAAEETAAAALKAGIRGRAYDSVGEAFAAAKEAAVAGDTIYAGGSTFVVADFLKVFEKDN